MQPLVPLVFHNLPSLYPPSFRRNDFLYFIPAVGEQAEDDRCPSHTAILSAAEEGSVSSETAINFSFCIF